MNDQECKVRPQIVNVNIDDPYAKLCVPDVVKNLII